MIGQLSIGLLHVYLIDDVILQLYFQIFFFKLESIVMSVYKLELLCRKYLY
jgi:hypothetical protein